jgi:CTP synthase
MRLGQYLCRIEKGSRAYESYRSTEIYERHRHRFEFNPEYEKPLSEAGLFISGKNPDYGLVEIVEIPGHPWFLGCQFHPEFKSRPLKPHPLFRSFIGASYAHRLKKKGKS